MQEKEDSFVNFEVMKFIFIKYWIVFFLIFDVLRGVAQDKPRSAEKLFELGESAHSTGDYKKAFELFNACLTENPGYTEAYFARASAREQLNDMEGALTDYSVFLERKPDNREALFSRGIVRYILKKYDQAYEDFTRFLEVPMGETQSIYFNRSASVGGSSQIITAQGGNTKLIYNYLGLIEQKRNNFKASITWLDSAIHLDPKNPDFYVNRALSRQGMKDTTAALDDFNKALTLHPEHTVALHNLAVLKRTASKQQAEPVTGDPLERAIESDSSMLYPYLERAFQRMEGGYLKGALDDYNRALEIETNDPQIWFNRGIVRERLKDYPGAFSDYTQAITLKEDFTNAWINRANTLLKQERYKDAIEDYTAALIYTPDLAPAYYNRAVARQKLKMVAEACEDLKKAEVLGMKVDKKFKEKVCVN